MQDVTNFCCQLTGSAIVRMLRSNITFVRRKIMAGLLWIFLVNDNAMIKGHLLS